MNSDRARQRAENCFKKQEKSTDAPQAPTDYEIRAAAIREKTERLKALRMAKEANAPVSGGDK